jgi:BCD family chlorophyll transporter-like MFS transporter
VLLEPFGGEILAMTVGQTTLLTALWAFGALIGFAWAARMLESGANLYRVAALGALIGIFAFSALVFAAPLQSGGLLRAGAFLIGAGGGMFAVGTMLAAMEIADASDSGMAIGAWSAVQATAIGLALACGGGIRDGISSLAGSGALGEALHSPATGYIVVYHIEIGLLFVSLAALGPLVGRAGRPARNPDKQFGLAELPV